MAIGSDELLEQTAPRIRGQRPRLFVWAAIVALAVVLIGFSRTYYLKGFFGTPDLTTLVHMHGLVMTLWFATLVAQVTLVARGNLKAHRKLGYAGMGLAVLVLVVGTATAIAGAQRGNTPGPPPLVFLAVPLGDMVVFALLIGLGFAYRARSDWHKRFMVCASLGIIAAALARTPLRDAGGIPAVFGTMDAILLAFMVGDWIHNKRLHPAFAIGVAVVILSQVGRFMLAGTPQWMQFARWLTGA
jgi:uncharacterized membrane protein YozB (DUF420 family)